MEVLLENRGASCFIRLTDIDRISDYEEKVLTANQPEYLIPYEPVPVDTEDEVSYRIDGMERLDEIVRRLPPGKKELLRILQDLSDCILDVEQYLLCPSHLLLKLQTVMWDAEKYHYRFLMVPGGNLNFAVEMQRFLNEMMKFYNHQNREEAVYFYEFYNQCMNGGFTPDVFLKWMRKRDIPEDISEDIPVEEHSSQRIRNGSGVEGEMSAKSSKKSSVRLLIGVGAGLLILGALAVFLIGISALKWVSVGMAGYLAYLMAELLTGKEEKTETEEKQETRVNRSIEKDTEKKADFCTEIIQDETETDTVYRLIPAETGIFPEYQLIPGENVVGRSAVQCTVVLRAEGISRRHACLVLDESGTLTLRDEGSTNGTYLNHKRVPKGEMRQVHPGDLVGFADREFSVR